MSFVSVTDWDTIERAIHAWVVKASGLPNGSVIWSGSAKRRPQTVTAPPPDSQWISLLLGDDVEDSMPWVDVEDNPLTFTAFTFTASAVTPPGVLTATAHGRLTGDGPVQLTNVGGALPSGLQAGFDYWVITVDANHLRLAASFEDAIADTPIPAPVASAGTGVHTLSATADTVRAGAEILEVVRSTDAATLSIQCYGGPPTGRGRPLSVLQTVVKSAWLPSVRNALELAGVGVTTSGRVNDVGAALNSSRWEPRAHVDIKVWVTAEISEPGSVIERVEAAFEIADIETEALAVPLGFSLGEGDFIETVVETVFEVS